MNTNAKKRFLSIGDRDKVNTWVKEHAGYCKDASLAEIHKKCGRDTAVTMTTAQLRTSLEGLKIEWQRNPTPAPRHAQSSLFKQEDTGTIARALLVLLRHSTPDNAYNDLTNALEEIATRPSAAAGSTP